MSTPPLAISSFCPPAEPGVAFVKTKQKRQSFDCRFLMLALPIFPGRRQPSIVGRNELNYRVRNGNGWTLALINTNSSSGFPENMHIIRSIQALVKRKNGDPYRIRTDVNGVRGRCLNHLTNGPFAFSTSFPFQFT